MAIVEFALVGLFLVTLIAGAFDFGLAWRSGLAVTEAARTGARVGGGLSRSPATDFTLLTGVRASLTSAGLIDDTEVVVIFRSTTANGTAPVSCTRTPFSLSGNQCITLTGAQLKALVPSHFATGVSANPPTGTGCITSNYTLRTTSWCPNSSASARNNSISSNGEYIGVYVRYRHNYLFPIMGGDRLISRTAVMRLEPEPI